MRLIFSFYVKKGLKNLISFDKAIGKIKLTLVIHICIPGWDFYANICCYFPPAVFAASSAFF